MKTVKSELTKLKNAINQKINKEYDWLDSGITSTEIMQEIEKTYALLDKFDNADNSLEIAYVVVH